MSTDSNYLRFPCECVSGRSGGYSDPWANIARHKLLPNGTKEDILNLVAREPRTISQIATALKLAPPSVHTHINDLMRSELLRESAEWEKKYPTERYYEPNFPVFRAEECAEFQGLCEEMAQQVVAIFEQQRSNIERAFRNTTLPNDGWSLSDITQCLYANMQRRARQRLEELRILATQEQHANGVEWIFWAEEPPKNGRRKRRRRTG